MLTDLHVGSCYKAKRPLVLYSITSYATLGISPDDIVLVLSSEVVLDIGNLYIVTLDSKKFIYIQNQYENVGDDWNEVC